MPRFYSNSPSNSPTPGDKEESLPPLSNYDWTSEDEADRRVEKLEFPHQLNSGLIKRAKRMANLMTQKSPENVQQVSELFSQFRTQLHKLDDALRTELKKDGVDSTVWNEFNNRCDESMGRHSKFYQEVKSWLNSVDSSQRKSPTTLENSNPKSVRSKLTKDTFQNKKRNDAYRFNQQKFETDDQSSSDDSYQGHEHRNQRHRRNSPTVVYKIVDDQRRSALELDTLPKFDGKDPLKFAPFLLAFEERVLRVSSDSSTHYYALLKLTSGIPHEIVEESNLEDPTGAFNTAMKNLKKRYGNKDTVATQCIEMLDNFEKIREDDSEALDRFARFLRRCQSTIKVCGQPHMLDGPITLKSIYSKLPNHLLRKLRQASIQKSLNEESFGLNDIERLISTYAAELSQPIFCDFAKNKDSTKGKGGKKTDHKKEKSFNTNVEDCCPLCTQKHSLNDCSLFLKKPMNERQAFIKESKICFGCLTKAKHGFRWCKNRLKCKTCSKLHPTCLHREDLQKKSPENIPQNQGQSSSTPQKSSPNKEESQSSYHVASNSYARIKYPAVLVDIKIDGSNQWIRTYLGMDPYCSGVFLDKELLKLSGVKSKPRTVSLTTMQSNDSKVTYEEVKGIVVSSLDRQTESRIEVGLAKAQWPFEVAESPCQADVEGFDNLKKLPIAYCFEKIGILVGNNHPDIVKPLKTVDTVKNGPYATLHKFGWCINGPVSHNQKQNPTKCFMLKSDVNLSVSLEERFNAAFEKDFVDDDPHELQPSIEDKLWTKKIEESITKDSDNHIRMCLPFREENPILPNNYPQARVRLESLKKKLMKDPQYFESYNDFMKTMIKRKFVEEVPHDEKEPDDGKVWYLTHFAVRHKQKGSLRVVYDASLKYNNTSLNQKLLQGPDLLNSIVGVLLRFREGSYAFTGDLEKMYHQVRVNEEDKNFLRFLWYPEGDLSKPPVVYRLRVHLFGAKSSPSCAMFALRYIAKSLKVTTQIDRQVQIALNKSFYVDDILKSVDNVKKAIELARKLTSVLEENGFNLTGFASNSRELLKSLPTEKLSKEAKTVDLSSDDDSLPIEKSLGLVFNTDKDTIGYRSTPISQPLTKRGILSMLASVYDPLFLVSPAIVPGKRIFQEASDLKIGWDEEINDNLKKKWSDWVQDLPTLTSYEVPRSYHSLTMKGSRTYQLHVFADGSSIAYGAVAYLRIEDSFGQIETNIVMAKSRMVPLSKKALKTIPRIELNAAKLAVTLRNKILSELDIEVEKTVFWVDSTSTLSYIKSQTGRFQRFVENRVSFIRSSTDPRDWRHVPGKENVSDILSRGTKSFQEFVENKKWKFGPDFLAKSENEWPKILPTPQVSSNDVELVKATKAFVTKDTVAPLDKLFKSTSDFHKLCCRIAAMLRLKKILNDQVTVRQNPSSQSVAPTSHVKGPILVNEIATAEVAIWRHLQASDLGDIINSVKNNRPLGKHRMARLNPFIDDQGLLRVGGRLANSADLPYETKHPILLPRSHPVVKLFLRGLHRRIGHFGREYLVAEVRKRFHIIGLSSLARGISSECIVCRRVQQKPSEQIMAPLPKDRITPDLPPFTNTGVDFFGPFLVSRGRGKVQEKRYGALFTCLSSRAMHIEMAYALDVDSFLNALMRFQARRGPVTTLRCDNGTNFIAGEKQLRDSIDQWNENQVTDKLARHHIQWIKNPPASPHMGGAWEGEIRIIKKTFRSITSEMSGKSKLTDEILLTLFCEIEDLLNSRPLTEVSSDVDSFEALTPNHLLRPRTSALLPIGVFDKKDIYNKRRWRQVQYLVDCFWHRWRREYVPLLIERNKWTVPRRNIQVGDLVLVVDNLLPRNLWCLGRIQAIKTDANGHVRSVAVKVTRHRGSDQRLRTDPTIMERPISKVVLLKAVEELSDD